jgi:uncharacterized protein YxjI
MHAILNKNLFFVKEQIGAFRASNNYDIFDAETKEQLLTCREPNLGFFTKMFRFTDYKRMTPFHIEIRDMHGNLVMEVKRGTTFLMSKVEVFDENGRLVGSFKQKFLSIGGAFNVLDANEQTLCALKGKWTSWDFKFIRENVEFAHVTKKWAGLGKELFTSADNYVLSIDDKVPADNDLRILIMAAVMCIDMVLKE